MTWGRTGGAVVGTELDVGATRLGEVVLAVPVRAATLGGGGDVEGTAVEVVGGGTATGAADVDDVGAGAEKRERARARPLFPPVEVATLIDPSTTTSVRRPSLAAVRRPSCRRQCRARRGPGPRWAGTRRAAWPSRACGAGMLVASATPPAFVALARASPRRCRAWRGPGARWAGTRRDEWPSRACRPRIPGISATIPCAGSPSKLPGRDLFRHRGKHPRTDPRRAHAQRSGGSPQKYRLTCAFNGPGRPESGMGDQRGNIRPFGLSTSRAERVGALTSAFNNRC